MSSSPRFIHIQGARQHNLKDITIDIPRDKLVVLTGLSGSGKSSLAFDTIHAEGQRKYVETLSAYARQFLEQLQKPDIDHIEGLPPTIAIEQRSGGGGPRSTVATTTEIYDYLRLLYARVGEPHCWVCGQKIEKQSTSQIVDAVLAMPEGQKVMILAPLVRGQRGEHQEVFRDVQRQGFVRVRIDSVLYDVKHVPKLTKTRKHSVDVVVDRLVIKAGIGSRLAESIALALALGSDTVIICTERPPQSPPYEGGAKMSSPPYQGGAKMSSPPYQGGARGGEWTDHIFSARFACPKHPEANLPELSPRLFSFNSPHGACPVCNGLGNILEFDPELVVPDPTLSLTQGAIDAWRRSGQRLNTFYRKLIDDFCGQFDISPEVPFKNLPERQRQILLHGTTPETEAKYGAAFEGVLPNLKRRWASTETESVKQRLHAYMSERPCQACNGSRLREQALAVRIADTNLDELTRMSVTAAHQFLSNLKLTGERALIAEQILHEIVQRLRFMIDVGVGYLGLNRTSTSLSGGEAQRIRLATQVGSGLVGVCYVLDEPTMGLHQRDNQQLIGTLRRLTDAGNTVLVVEHDEDTIRAADHIIDMGPGAGAHGGQIVAQGPLPAIVEHPQSLTGQYLRGQMAVPIPERRRQVIAAQSIEIKGAAENNLKSIDVSIPLGCLVCVTGVSGSGKSTLVNDIFLRAMRRRLYNSRERPGEHDRIIGASRIDKVVEVDQSPIGRTPRSNPATYTGAFNLIRDLLAKTREAKLRGYAPSRFSFNVKGGRCEACQGQGTKRIEMHFLPDMYVECDVCKGTRYNRETLEIRYRGKNIADILDMRVEESIPFFDSFANLKQMLLALDEVGLSYIKLGQPATTLSGGEAQRVKLAAELGKTPTGHTLYALDEPTTGLHFADVHNLLRVLNRLADKGHTVLVIEHHLDVIKSADWIIDLGPEGGEQGGQIVAAGRPEDIAQTPSSYTGQFLRPRLCFAE